MDKINKRLKGTDSLLTNRRDIFERVRTLYQERKGVWCAIDFEAWEYDHQVITECGWRYIRWEGGKEVEEAKHLIVKEHQKYVNRQYVPDHRDVSACGRGVTISDILPRIIALAKVKL